MRATLFAVFEVRLEGARFHSRNSEPKSRICQIRNDLSWASLLSCQFRNGPPDCFGPVPSTELGHFDAPPCSPRPSLFSASTPHQTAGLLSAAYDPEPLADWASHTGTFAVPSPCAMECKYKRQPVLQSRADLRCESLPYSVFLNICRIAGPPSSPDVLGL